MTEAALRKSAMQIAAGLVANPALTEMYDKNVAIVAVSIALAVEAEIAEHIKSEKGPPK